MNIVQECQKYGFRYQGGNPILDYIKSWLRDEKQIHINITVDMAPNGNDSDKSLYYFAEIFDLTIYKVDIREFKMLSAPIKGNNYFNALEKGILTILPLLEVR